MKVATAAMKRNLIFLKDIASHHELSPAQFDFHPGTILGKNEKVMTIDPMFVRDFTEDFSLHNRVYTPTPKTYMIRERNRMDAEWYGHEIQIIVGAILHTNREMLLLELNKAGYIVDRYVVGTLTMVQGHSQVVTNKPNGNGYCQYDFISLLDDLGHNMGRELCEEIQLKSGSTAEQAQFKETLAYLPFSTRTKTSVVRYENEGTIRRHLCVYFDIDLDMYRDLPIYDHFITHNIISAETSKHDVRFVNYEDLLNLPSMDYLCDWVKGALLNSSWFNGFCDWVVEQKYDWTKEE